MMMPVGPAATGLPGAARRAAMLDVIGAAGFGRVGDLARLFGVSAVTVRHDLAALARSGALERVHGGAVPHRGEPGREAPVEQARQVSALEKRAIAQECLTLVESGMSLILDVGSTTAAIADALAARRDLAGLTVITNGITIALALERAAPRIRVIVTGGTLRSLQHSLVDPLAGVVLERLSAELAFLGCTGVHPVHGITNINLPETALKRLMIRRSAHAVVVADSSKIGVRHIARVADLDEIDALITGAAADRGVVRLLRERGLRVTLAGAPGAGPSA